jgi:hypothetical protein
MKILSQKVTIAIGRPRRTYMNALHPEEEDDRITANGKKDSFITTESIGKTLNRNEAIEFVRVATAGHV